MATTTLSRQELYDLVWSNPMTTLAKKYLISDSGLRKICVKMEIPLPNTGHWEKLRANKPVEIKKLRENYAGEKEVELTIREEGDENLSGVPSAEQLLIREIENDPKLNLVVPERLINPHKLIAETKQLLSDRQGHQRGGLVGSWDSKIRITVSKQNIPRALRIMDTFIKAMEQRGHEFKSKNNLTYVVLFGEEFAINLREKNKRVPNPPTTHGWQTHDYVATGILAFVVKIRWADTEWKDGKIPLENQLAKIIARLEIRGAKERDETIEREKQHKIREEQIQILRNKEKRIELELERFKGLKKGADIWQEACRIRAYLAEVERKATESHTLTEELKEWLKWAHKKADWYDPVIATNDELLEGVDRVNLTFKKSGYY